MTDILIRDVPDDVIQALDVRAGTLGLSRTEYIRRRLAQEAGSSTTPVSAEDLRRFGEEFADLGDPEALAGAWD